MHRERHLHRGNDSCCISLHCNFDTTQGHAPTNPRRRFSAGLEAALGPGLDTAVGDHPSPVSVAPCRRRHCARRRPPPPSLTRRPSAVASRPTCPSAHHPYRPSPRWWWPAVVATRCSAGVGRISAVTRPRLRRPLHPPAPPRQWVSSPPPLPRVPRPPPPASPIMPPPSPLGPPPPPARPGRPPPSTPPPGGSPPPAGGGCCSACARRRPR